MNTKTLKTIALATVAGITIGIASVGLAEDRCGAGIGGGSGGKGSGIIVNGGTINARGGGVGDVTEQVVSDIANQVVHNDDTQQMVSDIATQVVHNDDTRQVVSGIATQVVNNNKQMIFDMVHPVNSVWIQYTENDDPTVLFNGTGFASTWTEITASYAGRYFKADTAVAAGSAQAESLPKPAGSAASNGSHTHAPGNLDVNSSYFGMARNNALYNRTRDGAFSYEKADSSKTYQDVKLDGSETHYVYNVRMSLGANWNTATRTASAGAHEHTLTINTSGAYKDGAAVMPLTSTIKVWKRTK